MQPSMPNGLTLIHPHGGTVAAYINHGRWVADCGNPHCHNARALAYGQNFLCVDDVHGDACGFAFDVRWPAPEEATRICAILAYRPDRSTRNWLPGESATVLLIENLAHGIRHANTPEVGGAASHLVLDASGDGPVVVRVSETPVLVDAAPEVAGFSAPEIGD